MELFATTFVHSCAIMRLSVSVNSFVQIKTAASLAHKVSKVVSPCVLERLSIHDELVEEVKLLLYGPRSKIVLLQALFDEIFHL